MSSVSPADIRDAVFRPLRAAGLRPPWAGQDEGAPSESDVMRLWREAANERRLTPAAVRASVRTWLDQPATTGSRWWPSPAEVLGAASAAAMNPDVPGCGRCSKEGLREVAVHHLDRQGAATVTVRMAHCDCDRGAYWSARRGEPLRYDDGETRAPGQRLGDYLDRVTGFGSYLAHYVDPTPRERLPRGHALPEAHRGVGGDWHRALNRHGARS